MSDILNMAKSVEQLIRGRDYNAAQFVDILIDTMNSQAQEVRNLPDPGPIGVTLFMAVSKGLVTDSDVKFSLLVLAFWSLWKSRKQNPTGYATRVTLNALIVSNPNLLQTFYENGLNEVNTGLSAAQKAEKRQKLKDLLKAGTVDESSDYDSYGDIAFAFVNPRILRS